MRRLLAAGMAAAFALGGLGIAQADPGPNDSNNHGLCTAFFNGQKNGHDKNGNPGPFQALIDEAGDSDGDGTPNEVEDVFVFCDGLIGGNPDHGRYDCREDPGDQDGNGDEVTCTDNPSPGKS